MGAFYLQSMSSPGGFTTFSAPAPTITVEAPAGRAQPDVVVVQMASAEIEMAVAQIALDRFDFSSAADTTVLGKPLEYLGLRLMFVVVLGLVFEAFAQRRVISDAVMIGLFVVGFGWWLTVQRLRADAARTAAAA